MLWRTVMLIELFLTVEKYLTKFTFEVAPLISGISFWIAFSLLKKKFHRKILDMQTGIGARPCPENFSIKFLFRFWFGFGDLCWFMTPPALWWTAWCNACWPGWTGCDCCCCCCCPILPPYAEIVKLFFKNLYEILGTRWFSMLSY